MAREKPEKLATRGPERLKKNKGQRAESENVAAFYPCGCYGQPHWLLFLALSLTPPFSDILAHLYSG